jgi:hypothetical protein
MCDPNHNRKLLNQVFSVLEFVAPNFAPLDEAAKSLVKTKGNVGDALEAAAGSYVGGQIGNIAGGQIGNIAGDTLNNPELGKTIGNISGNIVGSEVTQGTDKLLADIFHQNKSHTGSYTSAQPSTNATVNPVASSHAPTGGSGIGIGAQQPSSVPNIYPWVKPQTTGNQYV